MTTRKRTMPPHVFANPRIVGRRPPNHLLVLGGGEAHPPGSKTWEGSQRPAARARGNFAARGVVPLHRRLAGRLVDHRLAIARAPGALTHGVAGRLADPDGTAAALVASRRHPRFDFLFPLHGFYL